MRQSTIARSAIAAAAALLIGSSSVFAEDWPRWRGPQGDGISRETGLLDKWPASFKPLWSAEVGRGYSSPVALNGRVYLFSLVKSKDNLTCYDAQTGGVIWSETYDAGYNGNYGGTRATPNIDGDRIYTYGGSGELTARDLATGKQIWRLNTLQQTRSQPQKWGQASNPLVHGDLIYVQNGIGTTAAVAVEKNAGTIAWKSQASGSGSYAHPLLIDVQGKKQLVVFAVEGPTGMDPETGKTLWQQPWQVRSQVNASDPIYREPHLFVTNSYGVGSLMLELSPTGAKRVWENADVTGRFQPATLDGDHLYVNSESTLKCLKWPTREVVWSTPNNEKNLLGVGGTMVRFGGDKMIILSQSGRLTLAKVTPQGFERISDIPAFLEGREIWSTPTIYNGKLYAKGDNEMVCVDLKAP